MLYLGEMDMGHFFTLPNRAISIDTWTTLHNPTHGRHRKIQPNPRHGWTRPMCIAAISLDPVAKIWFKI